ncbi:hypothetical protein DH2020_004605 [Rehmannia glutinosa]|uniref:Uncharacterized protein n=1 Tax=Rehmannia glutinosa TaxID=99300 RepID=A0ABR0XPX8_REHGL
MASLATHFTASSSSVPLAYAAFSALSPSSSKTHLSTDQKYVLVLVILKESLDLFSLPESFVFLFAGIAFLVEFYMTGRGVANGFFAEFILSSGLVLKGTWVLQVGLSLYTDAFGFKGCHKISGVTLAKGDADIKCELEDDMWRGIVLMNFLFVGHVIVVMFAGFVLFGLLNRYTNMRCGETSGLLLAEIGSESMLMHPLPELEME